jgi:hypothetical protein
MAARPTAAFRAVARGRGAGAPTRHLATAGPSPLPSRPPISIGPSLGRRLSNYRGGCSMDSQAGACGALPRRSEANRAVEWGRIPAGPSPLSLTPRDLRHEVDLGLGWEMNRFDQRARCNRHPTTRRNRPRMKTNRPPRPSGGRSATRWSREGSTVDVSAQPTSGARTRRGVPSGVGQSAAMRNRT